MMQPVARIADLNQFSMPEVLQSAILAGSMFQTCRCVEQQGGAGDCFPDTGRLIQVEPSGCPGIGIGIKFPGIGAVFIAIASVYG